MAEILYQAVLTDWRREEKYRFLDAKEDIVRILGQVITVSLKTVKVVKSEWQAILDRPLGDICQIFETDNEERRRLRQNSPFAGVLPPSEVWSIKAVIRKAPSNPALREWRRRVTLEVVEKSAEIYAKA